MIPLTFVVVSTLVILTPGPDTALTVRAGAVSGRRTAVGVALGVGAGQLIWAASTAVGIHTMLAASEGAYAVLWVAGSAYLIWIGAGAVVRAVRGGSTFGNDERRTGVGHARTGFAQGLVSNLLNPKMLAFFGALLPPFAASPAHMLFLGLVFVALTVLWLTLIAHLSGVVVSSRTNLARATSYTSGLGLILLGAHLLVSRPVAG